MTRDPHRKLLTGRRHIKKKSDLLGMAYGTASHRLRRALMFRMAQMLNIDICFRCKRQIETLDTLSMEHIVAWQSAKDPIAAFFDLDNVTFSHLLCNIAVTSQPSKLYLTPDERRLRKSQQSKNSRTAKKSPLLSPPNGANVDG